MYMCTYIKSGPPIFPNKRLYSLNFSLRGLFVWKTRWSRFSPDVTLSRNPLFIVGVGLYLEASVVDHSCTPNANVIFRGNELLLRSIDNIESFSDVRISYTNLLGMSIVIPRTSLGPQSLRSLGLKVELSSQIALKPNFTVSKK